MILFSTNYIIVFSIFIFTLIFTIYSYGNTNLKIENYKKWLLILLRFIGLSLLIFTLFEPIFKTKTIKVSEPIVVASFDNSLSMQLMGLSKNKRIDECKLIAKFLNDSISHFNFTANQFSDSIFSFDLSSYSKVLTGSMNETNLSLPISCVSDSLKNNNISALLIVTDGQFNAGTNPIFDAEKVGIPVYTIGLGDSLEPNDASIEQIYTNKLTYINSEIPIDITYKINSNADNKKSFLTLFANGNKISVKNLLVSKGVSENTVTFNYIPKNEGIVKFSTTISELENEFTVKNNSKSIYVTVKSNKRKVTIIASSPSPDLSFIKNIIEKNNNFSVNTFVQKPDGSFIEGKLNRDEFSKTEVLILLGFPSDKSSLESIKFVNDIISNKNFPLLVFVQSNTDFNKLKLLESSLPITVSQINNSEMSIFTEITQKGLESPATKVSNFSKWKNLPPIFKTETSCKAKPESEVLANVKLSNSVLNEPLIVSRKIGNSRSLIFLGYGFYRWHLIGDALLESKGEQPLNILDDFISNSINWVGIKDVEKYFSVITNKSIYQVGEKVKVIAQVYDQSYKTITNAIVKVKIYGEDQKNYNLNLIFDSEGNYENSISNLPIGDYSFTGEAFSNNKSIGKDNGRFSIDDLSLELSKPTMNVSLLDLLTKKTGGKFYTFNNFKNILKDIKNSKNFKPKSLEIINNLSLWQNVWLLLISLFSFSIEWMIRKFSGLV